MNPLTIPPSTLPDLISRLTPRQLEIVGLLAQGRNYNQICTLLSISLTVVKHHVWRACRKMEVENRVQLIVIFARWKEGQNDA